MKHISSKAYRTLEKRWPSLTLIRSVPRSLQLLPWWWGDWPRRRLLVSGSSHQCLKQLRAVAHTTWKRTHPFQTAQGEDAPMASRHTPAPLNCRHQLRRSLILTVKGAQDHAYRETSRLSRDHELDVPGNCIFTDPRFHPRLTKFITSLNRKRQKHKTSQITGNLLCGKQVLVHRS